MVNATNQNAFEALTNQTEEGLNGKDFFHMKFEDLGEIESDEIFACCLINILIEIFGNGFLVLMIINQASVIKPKEKTVINHLITYMCWNYLFNNIVNAPIVTYGIIVNDIGKLRNSCWIKITFFLIFINCCRTSTCNFYHLLCDLLDPIVEFHFG